MGNKPDKCKKTAPEGSGAVIREQLKLFIGFVLNGLAGIFHVLTEAICGMASGKNNLPHNCNQKTEYGSFQCFHFFPLGCELGAFYNRPSNARMTIMISRSPTIPPGPYPQLLLYPQVGKTPINASINRMINIVPRLITSLLS